MADGSLIPPDAGNIPTEGQIPGKDRASNPSRELPAVGAIREETIQKATEPSEVSTQAKIERIDQELAKIDGIQEPKELKSANPSDSEDDNSIAKARQQDKIQIPNALALESKALNLLFNTNVLGKENLEAIPRGKNIIIVTTHNTDSDVGLAINALSKYYKNITVAEESTHYTFRQDPIAYLGRLLHFKNAFRVDYSDGGVKRRGKFNPGNFKPMKKSLEEGKPLVMAAYFTPKYSNTANGMPENPGNSVAYLSQISKDTIILPVAVDVKLDEPVLKKSDNDKLFRQRVKGGRVNADVIIGKPFVPQRIENIDRLGEIIQKRKLGAEALTEDERREYSSLRIQLQEQSGAIMQRLAELLPEQKRGIWDPTFTDGGGI